MRIAIVDDCVNDQTILLHALQEVFDESGIEIDRLQLFNSGHELLENLSYHAFDIIFLDIFMDDFTGIETARNIRDIDQDVRLVFATSSNEFASESFAVDACHYLLKPIDHAKIKAVMNRIQVHQLLAKRSILLPDGKKVVLKSIIYTECCDHHVHLYLLDGRMMTTRLSHAKLEAMLCNYPQFFCSSKGVLVNFDYVAQVDQLDFIMKNKAHVPISRRRRKAALEAYHDYVFHRLKEES